MLIDIPEIYTRNNYARVLSVMEELQTKDIEDYLNRDERMWMDKANKYLYIHQDTYFEKEIQIELEQEEAYLEYID